MRIIKTVFGFLSAFCLAGMISPSAVFADQITKEREMLSATIDDDTYALETQILRPSGPGPFPLAVVTHGSPRGSSGRRRMTTNTYVPQAMEFAQRGYLTAIVLRRGYGKSEGRWFEEYGECDFPYYDKAAATTAEDILGAIAVLKKRPDVDGTRILVVGKSAGGIGAVALAAKNPPGIVATINFAGGRGSRSHGEVCSEGELVDAYEKFGETARIPTLWVYAENDGFFNPRLARKFHEAFTGAGGSAELIQTGPYGREGHNLFSKGGIERWRPMVDDFLRKTGLPTWETPPPLPVTLNIAPPEGLSERGKGRWLRYLDGPDNKAFAKSRSSPRFGWRTGRDTIEEAKASALGYCKVDDCEVISVNGSAPN